MTTPKQCAGAGTHDGQTWQCERPGKDKARHLGHVCQAHYRQWERAGYPDAFGFAPLRTYEAGAARVVVPIYMPSELADAIKAKAEAEGRSVSSLGRRALERLLDDSEATS